MLIVGENGSPNQNGNTGELLRLVLDKAAALGARTALIDCAALLAACDQPFCTACATPCPGVCYADTPLAAAFELLKEADGLVVGSPVYFGTVAAQLKAFFDKARKVRAGKELYNTVGAALAVGASRFGGQETTIRAIHDILLVQGLILVGDGYGDDDCGHQGVGAQRPVQTDDCAKKRADILAKRLIEVCQATAPLRRKS